MTNERDLKTKLDREHLPVRLPGRRAENRDRNHDHAQNPLQDQSRVHGLIQNLDPGLVRDPNPSHHPDHTANRGRGRGLERRSRGTRQNRGLDQSQLRVRGPAPQPSPRPDRRRARNRVPNQDRDQDRSPLVAVVAALAVAAAPKADPRANKE